MDDTNDAYEPEEDYDDGPEIPAKEEPDCYACNDSGCPQCGYVDPQDPEHQKYLAEQIIQARASAANLTADTTEDERHEAIIGLPDVDGTSLTAIGDLVSRAFVTVHVQWLDPTTEPLF